MGVDYRSGIAKGYIISRKDLLSAASRYEQLNPNDDFIEFLYSKDYLMCLNEYISEPDYILAYDVCTSCDGGARVIDTIECDLEKDKEVEELYQQYFSNDGVKPQLLCYLSVT